MSNENRGWLKANFGVRRFVPAVWAGTSNPVMREIERDAKPLGGSFVRHEDYAELQGVAVEVWRIADEKSARIRELEAENKALREALDPDQTKDAYIGEVTDTVEVERYNLAKEELVSGSIQHVISWTAIKEIMAMIRARALSEGEG